MKDELVILYGLAFDGKRMEKIGYPALLLTQWN